jgi:hypothetical protein
MMIQRSALGPVVATFAAIALVVGACSSSATPSPSVAAPASVPASSAPASAAPSVDLGSLLPSILNSATDLEALLPSTICAKPAQKYSFNGDAFAAAGSSTDPTFLAVLQALGKTPKDVSFAVATVVDPTCNTTFVAFRIQGVDQGQFEQLYVAASTKNDGVAPTKLSLGGKDVWKSPSGSGATSTYAYFKGDTLLGVVAPTDDKAAAGLSALP